MNVRTGEKKPLLTGFGGYTAPTPNLSPTGKYLLAFDGKDWFTISVPDGKRTNLTAKLKVKFFNEDDDHPGDAAARRSAAWTTDGKFVLVNDRYDIWKLAADGSSAENLTKIGRAQRDPLHAPPRAAQDDDDEPVRGVDLSKPLLLGAENLHTRDTGFYRLEPGAASRRLLVMGARALRPADARRRTRTSYLLTVQTFSDYPDYYVTDAGLPRTQARHRHQPEGRSEFNWGKAELVHYKSTDGVPLSGVLVKPENFDPTKKYPMIVYIYERLSRHAAHVPPADRDPRAGHQPDLLRQQRLPRADAGHRLQGRLRRARARSSACCRRSRPWSIRASWTRRPSASTASRGAATRSRTW